MMIAVFPILFVGWKIVKKTKWLTPHEVVLRTKEVDDIDEYTAQYMKRKPANGMVKLVDKLFA